MLNLPIITSVRAITFVTENEHLSACCTKEGQVLLYDDKCQRRPVAKFAERNASYTTISYTNRDRFVLLNYFSFILLFLYQLPCRQCLVGTTRGYMQLLDLRNGKCLKTYTTFTGSVTSIYCDPFEPYIFTTCLDRFLRIHNLDTKELIHKVHLIVILYCVKANLWVTDILIYLIYQYILIL